ncbi:hypothetical protein B0T24DRAFT_676342 [Lasiosphaeria ovina]|uniref:Uncharacterized protein n=1 Tax=Lasiosphaeria ovina TaxID=92902 RepID=A0AAE0NFS3_9PEZI|nr:hypothetical protein B0T24DRAFT_676342 [Lasiosphaeria ovina]
MARNHGYTWHDVVNHMGIFATLRLDDWLRDSVELIKSVSLPVSMIASATESMKYVVAIVDKIDEKRSKGFILAYFSSFLSRRRRGSVTEVSRQYGRLVMGVLGIYMNVNV